MEINLNSDNKHVNNSTSNPTIIYADLLPKELWMSIFLYTEEKEYARLACSCKKFKDILNLVESDCKAKCKALDLGRSFDTLKPLFDWQDIYYCDRPPIDYSSGAQFYWKTLYKSWLKYISKVKSTPTQSSAYYVSVMNSSTETVKRFTGLRCTDTYNYLYVGLQGDYNNGTELAICKLEDGEYYLGLSERSNYNIYELYSSFEKEFTDPDLTHLFIRGFKDLSYAFPAMCTEELLALPGIDIEFIKYAFIYNFEGTTRSQSYTRKQKQLVAIRRKKIKCSEVGCKQSASHSCAKVKCCTHCSCPNHKHKKN